MIDQPEAESVAAEDSAKRSAFLDDLRASGLLDRFYEDFRKRRTSDEPREPIRAPESLASLAGLELRLSAVETRLGQVDTRLAVVETKLENQASQIEKLDIQIEKLEVRLAAVEGKLGILDNRLGQIETRLTALEARLVAVEALLDASIKELRNQSRTDFRLLFGALIATALGLAGLMAKGFHWV